MPLALFILLSQILLVLLQDRRFDEEHPIEAASTPKTRVRGDSGWLRRFGCDPGWIWRFGSDSDWIWHKVRLPAVFQPICLACGGPVDILFAVVSSVAPVAAAGVAMQVRKKSKTASTVAAAGAPAAPLAAGGD